MGDNLVLIKMSPKQTPASSHSPSVQARDPAWVLPRGDLVLSLCPQGCLSGTAPVLAFSVKGVTQPKAQ